MPKMSRKQAGEQVQAGVNALSTALLEDEQVMKEAVDALFVGQTLTVVGVVGAAHGKGKRAAGEAAKELADLADRLLTQTGELFQKLAGVATGKALRAIESELYICEQTLNAKYRGLAVEACDAVGATAEAAREEYAARYDDACRTVLPWFIQQLTTELSHAGSEPYDVAIDRVLSLTPVKAPGHSGKGLWWKIPEHLHRVAREAEFGAVNWVRREAMRQFNEIGDNR